MSKLFEEIDYRETPIGPISLRRRRLISLDIDIFEIILGDEHLMSSLFTASEIALAKLGLADLEEKELDIVVGGLGLGYTAAAALEDDRVSSLIVVELLDAIVDWHAAGHLPLDPPLSDDPRCRIITDDFFALAKSVGGFDPDLPGRTFDAIFIDIDHTPDWLLDERSGNFYSEDGLLRLASHLRSGGIMGLWSDAREDASFTARLKQVFGTARAEPVTFNNPLQNKPFTQTVYLARKTLN
ncbi:polyamine aminopropyltransferase [Robiginitomaculum antarcticum]|uniref:spermidine synthase n=1 Tax=Robiginitomaculum antarcticum TaxID=437507 RepID=UPI00039B824F|nr:spermidine synthase [Robiginitomaculum antarcticum]